MDGKNFEVSLDWLTFTYKVPEKAQCGLLPIEHFYNDFPQFRDLAKKRGVSLDKGRFHYNNCVIIGSSEAGRGNGYNDFQILYCDEKYNIDLQKGNGTAYDFAHKMGVNVTVPGHSIPLLMDLLGISKDISSDLQVQSVFKFLKDNCCSASRVDIACDDFSKTFTAKSLVWEFMQGNVISNFHVGNAIWSTRNEGWTFYVGDRKKRMIRVYDKFYESKGLTDSVRYECEYHENFAKQIFNDIADNGFNFDFKTYCLDSFFKLSTLSPIYEEWEKLWAKGQFNEELREIKFPSYRPSDVYYYENSFRKAVYNYINTEMKYRGVLSVGFDLADIRGKPGRFNVRLANYFEHCNINGFFDFENQK